MPNLNQVTICGHLGRDIELQYTAGGTAVAKFSVAITDRIKRGEEWVDQTTWVDVTVWAKSAERAAEQLHKGSAVLVCGRLSVDSWEDKKTNQKRSKTYVTCEKWQALGGRQEKAEQEQQHPQEEPTPF